MVNGITELMRAASRGDRVLVEELLAAQVALDVQDAFGQTALNYAAGAGHAQIVAALVLAGADVTLRNHANLTGLEIAVARGHAAVSQLLRQSCLCTAARDGNLDLLAQMLAAGADVNAQLADGWTALMIATYHDQPAAVQALLRSGADVSCQTATGRTARTIALGLDHHECHLLLRDSTELPASAPAVVHGPDVLPPDSAGSELAPLSLGLPIDTP